MTNYRLYCCLDFDSLSQLDNYVTKMRTHNIQVVDTETIDTKQKSKQQKTKTYHHDRGLLLPAMTHLQEAFRGMDSLFTSIGKLSTGETTSNRKGDQRQKAKTEPQQKSSSLKRKKPNQSL